MMRIEKYNLVAAAWIDSVYLNVYSHKSEHSKINFEIYINSLNDNNKNPDSKNELPGFLLKLLPGQY